MVKNTIPFYGNEGNNNGAILPNGTINQTMFTAGANGAKVYGITISNSSFGVGETIDIKFTNTTYIVQVKSANIPGSGILDVMSLISCATMPGGAKYFNMPPGGTIKVTTGAGTSATVCVLGDDY